MVSFRGSNKASGLSGAFQLHSLMHSSFYSSAAVVWQVSRQHLKRGIGLGRVEGFQRIMGFLLLSLQGSFSTEQRLTLNAFMFVLYRVYNSFNTFHLLQRQGEVCFENTNRGSRKKWIPLPISNDGQIYPQATWPPL